MTQQEFMERTGITPTAEDFDLLLSAKTFHTK